MENVLMGVTMFAAILFCVVVVLLIRRSATKDALDRAHRKIDEMGWALLKSKQGNADSKLLLEEADEIARSNNRDLQTLRTAKVKADKRISALEAELSVTKTKLDTTSKRLADAMANTVKKAPAPKKAPAKKPAAKKPAAKKAPAKKTTTKKSR